jgi:hypothetical protein
MAKIIKPLSARQIETVKPIEKDFYLYDGDNLRLKVTPANSKIWIYFFTWEGKQKKVTIGNYRKSSSGDVGYTLEYTIITLNNL